MGPEQIRKAPGVVGARGLARLAHSTANVNWAKALLTANGVVFAARQIGVRLEAKFRLTPANFAAFIRAVQKAEDPSIHEPLIIAAAATLSGEPSGKAVFELPDNLDVQKALAAAIELLTWRLEDSALAQPYDPQAAHARFTAKSWKDNWAKARDAASQVEAGMTVQIRAGNQAVTAIGEQGPAYLLLVGSDGKAMPLSWTTFYIRLGALAEDQSFAESEVPSSVATTPDPLGLAPDLLAALPGFKFALVPFATTIFPESSYPNRAVVDQAELHQMVAVVPYPEGLGKLEFSISVPLLDTPVLLEVITGDGWHTRSGQFSFKAGQGHMGNVTVPSAFGGAASFFKAQSPEDISARRGEQAARVGDEVSKRVVVVLKPAVAPEVADVRRKILTVDKLSDFQAQELGDKLKEMTSCDPFYLNRLVEKGLITSAQLEKLGELIVAARERARRRTEVDRIIARRDDWRSEALTFGGGRGGLHTGVGGYAGLLGRATEFFEPDPFASPVIYVIYPYGVAAREELQPDIDTGVALVNNVVQLRR